MAQAAPAPAPAPKAPAAKPVAKPVCNPGEALNADGHCVFEANLVQADPKAAPAAPASAAKADPKAAAGPAAKAVTLKPVVAPVKPVCNPGEYLAADGICYFEAQTIQTKLSLLQTRSEPKKSLAIRSNLGPIDASKVDACQVGQMLAADNKCYSEHEAMIVNNSLLQKGSGIKSLVQFDANQEPEKIHTLIPEAYRTLAN
jgi:hypothetical protein